MIGRGAVGLVLFVLIAAGTVQAQTFTPDPVDAEAAKREGSLSSFLPSS